MADKPFPFWGDEWMNFQRNYWNALGALNPQRETPAEAAVSNPWAQALENWWQMMAPAVNSQTQDFYSRLVRQGQAYLEMSEEFSRLFRAGADAGQSAARWQESVNNTLEGMKRTFSQFGGDGRGARSGTAAWQLPLETWQRMVSSMSILPGDALQGINAPVGGLQERVEQFLSAPAVGQFRERQEQAQEFTRLWLEYQQALRDYMGSFTKLGVKCVEQLQQRFQERSESDEEPLTSMREVYDLWVDVCEEVYAEHAVTDEFVEIHGRLVNSLMALKQHGRLLVDEVLGALDMPTRKEIDTLHSRFQQMRREGKALRSELDELREQNQRSSESEAQRELKNLRGELEALREEVQRLSDVGARTEQSPSSAAPSTAKKAAPKRKAKTKTSSRSARPKKAASARQGRSAGKS